MRPEAHEVAFLALAGVTAGALALAGDGPLVEVLAGAGLYAAAVVSLPPKAKLAAAYAFAFWFYSAVVRIVPVLRESRFDEALLTIDRRLFGETPAALFDPSGWPAAVEALSAAYLSYHVYLHLALAAAFLRPVEETRRLCRPLYLAFALGFAGYLLVPAVGPWRAFPALFDRPLTGGLLAAANAHVVEAGSSVYDVFPSLHVGITLVLLAHDRRHARRRFRVMLPIACLLLVSTIALRYHYAVDLAAGGILALAAVWAGRFAGAETPRRPRRIARHADATGRLLT